MESTELPADELAAWCRRHLGVPPVETLFRSGHLSIVLGLRLADGREVVVKARRPGERLDACYQLQRRCFEAGYPCPEPLLAPQPLAGLSATVEAYLPDGAELPDAPDSPRLFAEALERLTRIATPASERLVLDPPWPWVDWRADCAGRRGLWPPPDDRDLDMNDYPEPRWLDELASRARQRLLSAAGEPVIGHSDWWQNNLRWTDRRLVAVHDWDSMVRLSEAGIAGAAAATFSTSGRGATTLDETAAFLVAYAIARGRAWSEDEAQVAWAAGVWRIAFDAKKEAVEEAAEAPDLEHLRRFGEERLRRAGA